MPGRVWSSHRGRIVIFERVSSQMPLSRKPNGFQEGDLYYFYLIPWDRGGGFADTFQRAISKSSTRGQHLDSPTRTTFWPVEEHLVMLKCEAC